MQGSGGGQEASSKQRSRSQGVVASRPERKEVIGTNRSQVQVMEADLKEDVALQMP